MTATNRDSIRSTAFAVGIAQSVAWLLVVVALLLIAPRFQRIFRDFGTTMPDMTMLVLRCARLIGRYWYFVFLPACLWPFVNWGVVWPLSRHPDVLVPLRLWYLATWLAIAIIALFALAALFYPLTILSGPLCATPPAPPPQP